MKLYHYFLIHLAFYIFVEIPLSICVNDLRYSNCSLAFNCGHIKGITYPFWGNTRPDYCGHPDFHLNCRDGHTEIKILPETYRVTKIDQNDQTMRIVNNDFFLYRTCPSRFFNISLNFSLLDYTPSDVNLTLLHLCSSSMHGYKYKCKENNKGVVYSLIGSDPKDMPLNLPKCNVTSIIPVLRTFVESDETILGTVLKGGFDVEYRLNTSICKECLKSGGQCGYNSTLVEPTCFWPHFAPAAAAPPPTVGKIKSTSVASMLGIIIIATMVVIFCCSRRKFSSNKLALWKTKTKNAQTVEMFLKNHESLASKRYKYSDIKKITNSFEDKLCQGAYGGVFKGKLVDKRVMAVKVLEESKGDGEEFINEVASISRTYHVHIVTLLGFCVEDSKRALIYEFMPNESLEKFIHDENPLQKQAHLKWEKLYKIFIGIARGLEYLHRGCNTRILHFDIKPHNILLDENFCPKISDFGLAKLCLKKESFISMMGVRGTPGYIAPKLINRNFGGVSHKSDVYSYGMMMLEMVGRRKYVDPGVENISEIYFPHWIYTRLDTCRDIGLHGISTTEDEEIARKMILVGLWCIQMDPSHRPAMNRVLEMLEGSLDAVQIPPMPFFTSPSRSPQASSTTTTL